MSDLAGVKPGDKLLVWSRSNRTIQPVIRVTPAGWVVVDRGTFNPDGRMRGDRSWDSTRARPATEDDIAAINRASIAERLRRFDWSKLNAVDLKAVDEIARRYAK